MVLVSSLSNGESVCICTGFLTGCTLLALRGILGSEPGRVSMFGEAYTSAAEEALPGLST